MQDTEHQIKEHLYQSELNFEEVFSSVRPLTRSDVNHVMAPIEKAEKVLEQTSFESNSDKRRIQDVIRFEKRFSRAALALHGINHGTRGDPLDEFLSLSEEQKLEQIYKQLVIAEHILSEIGPHVFEEYFEDSYREIEDALHSLQNMAEELVQQLNQEQYHIPEEPYSQSAPLPQQSASNNNSHGHLILGGILAIVGAIFSVTGIGMIIGVPLVLIGGAIMFPKFASIMVGLMVATALIFFF